MRQQLIVGTGSTAKTSASSGAVKNGGVVTLVEGTAPQSLDPGLDYTTQGSEVNWLVYTGITTYAHANGTAGTALIPGLGTALPRHLGGRQDVHRDAPQGPEVLQRMPVKATDFTSTVERAIKIPWGGASTFITPIIEGAAAYSTGKAKTISGITADNATGKIVIHLTKAYGPFDNVMAFPSLGLVPASTPDKPEPSSPPAGRWSLQGDEHRPERVLRRGQEPRLGLRGDPGHPVRSRHDRREGHSNVSAKRGVGAQQQR